MYLFICGHKSLDEMFRMLKNSTKWQAKLLSLCYNWNYNSTAAMWLNQIWNVYGPFLSLCIFLCNSMFHASANCRLQTHKEHFQLSGRSRRKKKNRFSSSIDSALKTFMNLPFPLCHIFVRQHKFDHHLWLPVVMMGDDWELDRV